MQSKYFDEAQEYLDEMFLGNEALIGKNLSDEELEQIFNSEDISLKGVVSYVQDRDKEQVEPTVPEDEETIEDNGVHINEFGEIIRLDNIQNEVVESVPQEDTSTTELSFMQRVAQRISSNKFLNKLPVIKKFAENKLKMLPEAKQKLQVVDTVDNKTDSFIKSLQALKKDDKEITSSFEEQDKIKDMQKKRDDKVEKTDDDFIW